MLWNSRAENMTREGAGHTKTLEQISRRLGSIQQEYDNKLAQDRAHRENK